MSTFDDLLLSFRAGVDADDAVADRVARAASERITRRERPRRPVWRRPRIVMPALGAAVAAGVLGFVLVGGGDNPGPDITARAAAALTPENRLLSVLSTVTVSSVQTDERGRTTSAPPESAGTIEDLSIAGPDRAFRLRRVWTSPGGGVQAEAVRLRDAEGRVTAALTWAAGPTGSAAGATLTIGSDPDTAAVQQPWPLVLSDALRRGALAEAGTAADGSVRLVGRRIDARAVTEDDCSSTELLVDPGTGVPKRLEMTSGCPGNSSSRQTTTVVFTSVTSEPVTPGAQRRLRYTVRPYAEAYRFDPDGSTRAATPEDVRAELAKLR